MDNLSFVMKGYRGLSEPVKLKPSINTEMPLKLCVPPTKVQCIKSLNKQTKNPGLSRYMVLS